MPYLSAPNTIPESETKVIYNSGDSEGFGKYILNVRIDKDIAQTYNNISFNSPGTFIGTTTFDPQEANDIALWYGSNGNYHLGKDNSEGVYLAIDDDIFSLYYLTNVRVAPVRDSFEGEQIIYGGSDHGNAYEVESTDEYHSTSYGRDPFIDTDGNYYQWWYYKNAVWLGITWYELDSPLTFLGYEYTYEDDDSVFDGQMRFGYDYETE